jgi:antitoxin ParD1/3/4
VPYVDGQVADGGYGYTSEHVRDLIRRDKERQQLRRVLLDGAASSQGPVANTSYFSSLRERIRAPDLMYHVVGDDVVDVWRVLHTRRDIPTAMGDDSDT